MAGGGPLTTRPDGARSADPALLAQQAERDLREGGGITTRIGILSDTHMPASLKEIWPEVGIAFAGVSLILHSGDICHPMVLDQLERWAPVIACKGNNDLFEADARVAEVQELEVEGWRIAMVHDMEPEDEPVDDLVHAYLGGRRADILVTGHTHFERLDWRDGVLQVNSGSPVYPHQWSTRLGTVALLELGPGALRARIVRLGESSGLKNPGAAYDFDGSTVTRTPPGAAAPTPPAPAVSTARGGASSTA